MSESMLSYLKVLDLTQGKAGPYCTKLMAEFGAEVIKVETPKIGDKTRSEGPYIQNQPGLEKSTLFHWLNSGKQSITLNLDKPQALEILTPLLRNADLLIESFKPGMLNSLGITREVIERINPRIVVTSISNFGSTGPYKDFQSSDIVQYALSGSMYLTGHPDKPPLNSGPAVVEYTAGLHAYIGTLLALFRRGKERNPETESEFVEISCQESALENIETKLVEALHHSKTARRDNDRHLFVPWKCYPTADGYVAAIGGPMRNWARAASMFEEPKLSDSPLNTAAGRIQNRKVTEELLELWFRQKKKRDVHQQGQANGLAFAYLADLAEAFQWQQLKAREFIQPSEPHSEVGSLEVCSQPFRPRSGNTRPKRAPLLGEHNDAIYTKRLGYTPDTLADWYREGLI
jgi:crotonobetainyl-CoA:carnitine CoA-transferase CaiB-like acyl-CoA transferase